MKTTKILEIVVLALCLILCPAELAGAAPMGTAWTYQGRLMDANSAADGVYDFQFKLFDDPCTGAQKGGTINEDDLDVIDGYFTVVLDFGNDVFDGDARWLQTTVAQGDGSDPCTLRPRLEITPVPYTLHTRGIFVDNGGNVGIGTKGPLGKLHVEGKVVAGQGYMMDDCAISADHDSGGSNGYVIKAMALPGAKYAGHFYAPFNGGVGLFACGQDFAGYFFGRSYFSGNVGIGTEQPQKLLHIVDKDGGYNGLGIRLDPHGGVYSGGTTWDINNNNGKLELSESRDLPDYPKTRLTISNGSVGIGTPNPSGLLEVSAWSFAPLTLDQSQTLTEMYRPDDTDCWQSFTAGITGKLERIDLWFARPCESETLYIYEGEGAGGVLLHSQPISSTVFSAWSTYDLSTPVNIIGGNKYTIRLISFCDGVVNGTKWGWKPGNPYAGGISDYGADEDYCFRTYVSALTPDGLIVTSNGSVGIGTTSPAGKLDVNGSIYQRGIELHADYVFGPDYDLASIEEHSEYMWNEKHLPGIPKARVDDNGREIIEVGEHRRGIVEELEKAHIYIEQLHKRIRGLEHQNDKMKSSIASIEIRLAGLAK